LPETEKPVFINATGGDNFNFPMTTAPNRFNVSPGQKATFNCKVSDGTTRFFKYLRGFSRITQTNPDQIEKAFAPSTTCTLTLDAVDEAGEGNYTVEATNNAGSSFLDFFVNVLNAPVVTSVSISPSGSVDPGSSPKFVASAFSELGQQSLLHLWFFSKSSSGPFLKVGTGSPFVINEVIEEKEGYYFSRVTLNAPVSSPELVTSSPQVFLNVRGT